MPAAAFRHEAFFYAGEDEFLAGIVPFVNDSIAAGEPILVAVDADKIRAIRRSLDGTEEHLYFADMEALGRNPACIIPAWREFVAEHGGSGRPIRGVGEPIWPGRSDDELGECHQHESLLNLAFAETSDFWLLCPYDTTALETDVLEEARCTHPLVSHGNGSVESRTYVPPESSAGPFAGELQPPAAPPEEMAFDRIALRDVRTFVSEQATCAGMGPDRTADLVLAVCEVATNSVLHGGGKGRLSAWREPGRIVCEVRDAGRFEDPLAGRARPSNEIATGRGLWLVNHLCDLLQIRSSATGNVIRLHMSLN